MLPLFETDSQLVFVCRLRICDCKHRWMCLTSKPSVHSCMDNTWQNHLSGLCLCYGCNCLHIAQQRHTLKSQVWKLVTCLVTLVSDTAALISNKAAGRPTSQSVELSGGNVNEQFCWTTSAATTSWTAAVLMILLGWDTFFSDAMAVYSPCFDIL